MYPNTTVLRKLDNEESTWEKAAQNLVCWKQQLHTSLIQRGEEKKTGQGAAESAGSTVATAEVQTRESLRPEMERTQQGLPVCRCGLAVRHLAAK